MEVVPQAVPAVKLLKPRVFRDERGFFLEAWREGTAGLSGFVQDNHSRSSKGTLRGLHYQLSHSAQGKLVGVIRGAILDVAVDLRLGSPTYGRHVTAVLSDENLNRLWVPRGFAHGFLVLSEVADVLYKVDNYYSSVHERGIAWNDPQLGIDWQAAWPETSLEPLLSQKDSVLPGLKDAECDFLYEGED